MEFIMPTINTSQAKSAGSIGLAGAFTTIASFIAERYGISIPPDVAIAVLTILSTGLAVIAHLDPKLTPVVDAIITTQGTQP
jgi:fluoride ion exporter CrcB/FEX